MSMTEEELRDGLQRAAMVLSAASKLTSNTVDDDLARILRGVSESEECVGGLWELLKKVGLIALAFLLFVPVLRAQPRVGEEERDQHGNLVHASLNLDDRHVQYRSRVERKAFLIWIWGRGRRDQERPPTTDPAVLQALGQLQQNQQRLIELLAQLQARGDRQPVQPPPPQIILIPQGQPYQPLPVEPRPRQDLPVEPRPRQDLPVEPRPRQDLPVEPKPRQDLPSDPRPRQDLPLSPGPRQDLGKPVPPAGDGKPFSPSPGEAKPPTGYQTYTRYPIQRAIYPVDGRR